MKKTILILAGITFCSYFASADEGMWTLNNFPSAKVKSKYGVDISKDWLQKSMKSSARIAGGCSASFVSENGLIMTNHHCVSSCIEQLSTASKDFIKSGFYAKSASNEVKCPEVEINKLIEITDVTKTVQDSTKNATDKDFYEKLKAVTSRLEKDCSGGTDKVRCDVVSLYRGGQYHLYRYERYQDVRLVFAPEFSAAFFGGDPDNFNFPRYDLDVSFVRVYENNSPLKTQDYFRWSKSGPKENELSFVVGNPGSTARLMTVADLKFIRQHSLFDRLISLSEQRGILTEFGERGPEQKRISAGRLFGVENSLKAGKGRFAVLMDPKFMEEKAKSEKSLRNKVNANPKLKKLYGNAWNEVDAAYKNYMKVYDEMDALERNGLGSRLYEIAKTLVRVTTETAKPNESRYPEYTDARLPYLKQNLLSSAPIYDELEITMMSFNLSKVRERLGTDHAVVKKMLGKKSPEDLAKELIKGTRLHDVKAREALFNGGRKAVEASDDPMIKFFLALDGDARRARDYFDEFVEAKIKHASEKIAKAQFAVYGDKLYPNATFSMRISYGQVKGWEENGKPVHPLTNFEGAFNRHTGHDPYALPESWFDAKKKLNLSTSLNFSSTNDIIGGNSGSPVINKDSEIVGLIFDGNIHSLGGDYGYDETKNRAVSVSSNGIMEALKQIYSADRIVEEITASAKVP